MKSSALCILSITIASLSCTIPGPIQSPVIDTYYVKGSFSEVWPAIVATASEMSLPIESIKKEKGLVTTKFLHFLEKVHAEKTIDKIAYKPHVVLGKWSKGRYKLRISARPVSDNLTSVTIYAHIEAFETRETKRWHICKSSGTLEDAFIRSVKSIIGDTSLDK